MKTLVSLIFLLGSLTVGCQNFDKPSAPQTGDTSPAQNSTDVPTPATSPTLHSTTKSKPEASIQSRSQVVTSPNRSVERQQTCQINAFVIDKDPKGLNVRSGPGSRYDIIGKLPTTTVAVIVDITAAQGDWVRLSKAQSVEKIEFQGTGWVYAQLLGTSTRGYGSKGVSVYASADTQSSVIGRIPDQRGVKLLGCDQSWALVEYEGLKGWIAREAQCPNPLTTCS